MERRNLVSARFKGMQKNRIGVGPILRIRHAQVNWFFLSPRGMRAISQCSSSKLARAAHMNPVHFLFDMLNTALRPALNQGTFLRIRPSLLAGWVACRGLKGLRSDDLLPASRVSLSAG